MDTRKSILDLEAFRKMLHISPRILSQFFAELPFEEEILEFLRSLGHSDEIRHLTDVNFNELYQPWRSFASVINKCLSGKSSGIDNFVYKVEHKNQKRTNEMYYPIFTKVIIDYFMTRKPSIPRRNRINWHYVRDDVLFSTINVVSRHQTTQQYGAILPIELTTDDKAEQLKIVLRRSRQETHISQQHGSGTDEGTGSRPGVPDVPSDDSEEELS
nr:hypothetical protein [Tanacetum cinerariifolium]